MSDTENPTDDQSQSDDDSGADASDLKARLGLRTRKRRVSRPTGTSLGAGGDVADARQRAADASSSAGTPEESFTPFANEDTPLPQPLPGSGQDIDVPDGGAKIATKPLVVTLLLVGAVGLFLGSVLGGSLEQQGLREGHASYAEMKLEAISKAKTRSGGDFIPALTAIQASLKTAAKELEKAKVAKTGGEEQRTKVLKGIMGELKTMVDDGVYCDPKRLMDDIMVLYPDDELLEAVKFAVKTRHLYDLATAAVHEAKSYDRMSAGPFLAARVKSGGKGGASKSVLIRRIEREVPELGKLPAAEGSWIMDTGKPRKVKLVGKKGGGSGANERWELMVVEVGKTPDQAVQVPTSDVMILDMTPEYESHAELLQKLKRDRLETLVAGLATVSGTIDWPDLEQKLTARAK